MRIPSHPSIHALILMSLGCRRHNFIRLPLSSIQTLPRPHPLLHRRTNRERLDDLNGTNVPHRRAQHASPEFVGERGVLENLDLVLLCLDETIDDGWVLLLLPSSSVVRLTQVGFLRMIVDRCHSHRFPRPQAAPRHDGNSHQRANDHERVSA